MVELVEREVRIGLEVRASLETANDLIRKLHGKPYLAAGCVDSIQGSQAMHLALTLAKLFEMPRPRNGETHARRYNRSEAASIPLLIRLIRQRRVRAHFASAARRWTPQIPEFADKHARDSLDAFDRAIESYASFCGSRAGRSAILRLRSFRNKLLAHLLVTRPSQVRSTYRDIFLLLTAAQEVVEHSALAINGHNLDLGAYERDKVLRAKAFWEVSLPAVISADR